MKIAICKGFSNITFSKNNRSAGSADIEYFISQLGNKVDVDIISSRTKNTEIPNNLGFVETAEVNFDDYDLVCLFNFSINFFGGKENVGGIDLYRKLSKSSTNIAYIQTDARLPFQKLWPAIKGRDWASEYKESDFVIDQSRVTYITQGRDLDKVKSILTKDSMQEANKFIHYPIAETFLSNVVEFNPLLALINQRPYDLGFGGATRDSHKVKKVKQFYVNPEMNNYIFGGIDLGPEVTVNPKVSYQNMISTMSKCKGAVIVGDKHYEDNYFTLRMYEGIVAGCLTYIDKDFDTTQEFYDGKFPELYISKKEEIVHLNNKELISESNRYIIGKYNFEKSRDNLISLLESIK